MTKLLDPMQRHPPLNPTIQRRLLVSAEIDSHLFLERKKNAAEIVGCLKIQSLRFRPITQCSSKIGMIGDAPDFSRNLARWQNHIDKTRANCAPWHRIELRTRVLCESDTARCLNRAQTSSPVAAGSGKEDADGAGPALFRKRFKKMIDREIQLPGSAN